MGAAILEEGRRFVITIDEIREVAATVRLTNTVVEKDYALGWLLWGIHQHTATKDDWVFKGGTCLKKCFFETYRFSEDLDFSFRGSTPPTIEQLVQTFSEISDLIFNEAGLEFPKESIQFEIFQNPRDSQSIQGGIKYRGPVRPQVGIAHMQRIKIDLTLDEPLVLSPVIRSVEHRYSDKPAKLTILSYDYEEIFAEKVRALGQRLRPRDLYDVIHLYRRMDLKPDQTKIYSTLESKCKLRGISIPTIEAIETHDNRQLLESEWETQLKHQIFVLPDFQSFLSELPAALEWIHGIQVEELAPLSVAEVGEEEATTVQERVSTLVLPGPNTSVLDQIRFAAANRLLVRLGYNRSFRDIEPYSLARSSDGNLLLQAIRSSNRESRSYRFDRIESVSVTHQTFTPEYAIEITSAGHLPIHQLTRQQSTAKKTRRSSFSSLPRSGPTYVYKCSLCGKTSQKKKMDSRLNPHKNKSGYPCPGRTGIYQTTKY